MSCFGFMIEIATNIKIIERGKGDYAKRLSFQLQCTRSYGAYNLIERARCIGGAGPLGPTPGSVRKISEIRDSKFVNLSTTTACNLISVEYYNQHANGTWLNPFAFCFFR